MLDRIESEFAERVRAIRRYQQLTQRQLAHRSALSEDSIRRIERARFAPSLGTLAKLANGFELPLATLFLPARLESKPDLDALLRTPHEVIQAVARSGRVREIVSLLEQRSDDELDTVLAVIRAVLEHVPASDE